MPRILRKESLAPDIFLLEIEEERIARKAKPGQFVVLMPLSTSERIPISLHDWHPDKGTIEIVFLRVGRTTAELAYLQPGDDIHTLLGPLGVPMEIEKVGKVFCIGGGVGVSAIYPLARAFKERGNHVVSIIGARSEKLLILEEKMRQVSDECFITTDDGSYGRKGFTVDVLRELLEKDEQMDLVVAIGPLPMMEAVANATRPFGIKTVVSLNPLMLDATGMCGVCRVKVGGKTYFACVDGPKFDGHQVDFADLRRRLAMYKEEEARALAEWKEKI